MTNEDASRLLEQAAAALGEHFDAVQIVASRPMDGGGTACTKRGAGNFYARLAMCREFIENNSQGDAAEFLARKINPPDEGDDWKTPT